jgi:hypothetical protein
MCHMTLFLIKEQKLVSKWTEYSFQLRLVYTIRFWLVFKTFKKFNFLLNSNRNCRRTTILVSRCIEMTTKLSEFKKIIIILFLQPARWEAGRWYMLLNAKEKAFSPVHPLGINHLGINHLGIQERKGSKYWG